MFHCPPLNHLNSKHETLSRIGVMLGQDCGWPNIRLSLDQCLVLAGISNQQQPPVGVRKMWQHTGYSEVWFFCKVFYFTAFHEVYHYMWWLMIKSNKVWYCLITFWLYFEMPIKYRIKNCQCFFQENHENKKTKKMVYVTISHGQGRAS